MCRPFVAALAAPLLLVSSFAVAQPVAVDCTGHDATTCGRMYFQAGTEAFERADYPGAAAQFQAALEQRPHPVIRFNLALSLTRLGKPSAALEQLRLVQQDAEADKDLRNRAERESKSAQQALARVSFRLSDPSRERVELDGTPVPLAGRSELAIDPGAHHVRVISGRSVVLDQDLDLSPGERVELRVGERSRRIDVVVVPPEAVPKVSTQPSKPKPPARVAVAPGRPLSPVWFYAAAGGTLALTGLTVWSGLDTQSALSDYERDLPHLTQTQANRRVSQGHGRELRTNLLLAGSLVAGAGTAVLGLWFVDFRGSGRATVGLAPGRVALSGQF
jgi:hypothetical protein